VEGGLLGEGVRCLWVRVNPIYIYRVNPRLMHTNSLSSPPAARGRPPPGLRHINRGSYSWLMNQGLIESRVPWALSHSLYTYINIRIYMYSCINECTYIYLYVYIYIYIYIYIYRVNPRLLHDRFLQLTSNSARQASSGSSPQMAIYIYIYMYIYICIYIYMYIYVCMYRS